MITLPSLFYKTAWMMYMLLFGCHTVYKIYPRNDVVLYLAIERTLKCYVHWSRIVRLTDIYVKFHFAYKPTMRMTGNSAQKECRRHVISCKQTFWTNRAMIASCIVAYSLLSLFMNRTIITTKSPKCTTVNRSYIDIYTNVSLGEQNLICVIFQDSCWWTQT